MKTTTQLVDEEHEHLREKGLINWERYELETQLMQWLLWEENRIARVTLGEVRKAKTKGEPYARVTRKLPRIIRIQSNHRRVQAASNIRNRPESSIHT